MRRQCAIFVAELSLAEGMPELINDLDTPKLKPPPPGRAEARRQGSGRRRQGVEH